MPLLIQCLTCADLGYVWIPCVRYTTAHYRRKGDDQHAVVARHERFRAPCDCECGARWIEARRSGDELADDD